ncbi:MAG: hypothetical protein KIT14_03580 [bacterium]|nr:hypothetical protein [bacterium]
MRGRGAGRAVGLVAMAALVGGCTLFRPLPSRVQATSAPALLESLAARRAATTSLRARARVKAGLAGVWTREAVLVRRPESVRMDVMSPFGLALAVGTDGPLLWVYPPSRGVRYDGEASPANLARFLGAPVTVPDLVDILLGVAPAREPIAEPRLALRGDEYAVTLDFADGVQTLWFSGATLDLVRAEEAREGVVSMQLAFGDHRDGFPHTIEVAAPLSGATASLAYDQIERNAEIDANLFAPPVVPAVQPLDGVATPG